MGTERAKLMWKWLFAAEIAIDALSEKQWQRKTAFEGGRKGHNTINLLELPV